MYYCNQGLFCSYTMLAKVAHNILLFSLTKYFTFFYFYRLITYALFDKNYINIPISENTHWTQNVNWTYMRYSDDVQDVYWT